MSIVHRVALVTGGAKRIGRAIALRLARSGYHVAVHYKTSRDEAEETVAGCRALGVDAFSVRADFLDLGSTARLPEVVLERHGQLDVLVNNASVFDRMTLEQFDVVDWERTFRVNLVAPMVLAHAARAALVRARGRIVNICDASTSRPWPDHLAYAVSKGGLDTLTRVLAKAFAPAVNVVGIAPGAAIWPESYDEGTQTRLIARIPLQRAGTVDDIAAAVHFVLSEGDYMTGAIIPIDGGRHLE